MKRQYIISGAAKAERDAKILELLKGGMRRKDVAKTMKCDTGAVSRVARWHKVARSNAAAEKRRLTRTLPGKGIEALTHAQLDALEADIAAKRACGLLPPIVPD